MKYIRKFEEKNSEPKEGDYVLMNSTMMNPNLNEFIDNEVGKIVKIDDKRGFISVEVEYENIPMEIASLFGYNDYKNHENTGIKVFLMSSIIEFSDNKTDLEYKINARKFNL